MDFNVCIGLKELQLKIKETVENQKVPIPYRFQQLYQEYFHTYVMNNYPLPWGLHSLSDIPGPIIDIIFPENRAEAGCEEQKVGEEQQGGGDAGGEVTAAEARHWKTEVPGTVHKRALPCTSQEGGGSGEGWRGSCRQVGCDCVALD